MSLTISRAVFNELLYCMKADPSVKYMICRNYDGFHEYHGRGFLLTRFIGTSVYALVWTFDPTTLTTRMLFLQRQNRQDTFPLFVDLVRAHRAYIFTPSFPCYLSCHFLLHISDHDAGGWELGVIRHVEEQTGFGLHPFGWRGVEPLKLVEKFNINQLTSWLQAVNEVAMNASNRSRHQNNSYVLLEVIKAEHKNGGRHYGILPGKALQLHQEKMEELIEALPALERHIAAYIDFEVYFKQRADRLSSVLFALMTHEDANASIGLAAATRNDSASMKTIAIMTMAFLPATFFAALFSMPSLRWDQPAVVQDRFWVYWAFTVPTTIAVFLVWLLITKRKWIFRGIGGLLMKHGVGVQHVNMK
ncbi:hypothetical protein N656DRAFT_785159 [Canariomyces notabilis]|uniref:Uncharacterized protein n=1 Tax=Canariomyces notabilis TaxID=2074819 RepID=A0AAN6QDC8_9PEZI|nr:hypothetical protein N656DRAFT_785159 [Canariomyces arenarius]